MALAGGQCKQVGALQIIGNKVVKLLFLRGGKEFLHDGLAIRVGNIFEHLPPQGALADGFQPCLQIGEVLFGGEAGELRFETFEIAKSVIVNDADQPI